MEKAGRARCSPKPELKHRPLPTDAQVDGALGLLKILSRDARVRILHALVRSGELCAGEFAETVGMKPQAVSNQRRRLSGAGILVSRRDGNKIIYRVADPCAAKLLDTSPFPLEDTGRL